VLNEELIKVETILLYMTMGILIVLVVAIVVVLLFLRSLEKDLEGY
jgi:hypothetical protein